MTNSQTFKNITNNDIYDKLISIEKIARRNQVQIGIMWVLMIILFTAIIGNYIL